MVMAHGACVKQPQLVCGEQCPGSFWAIIVGQDPSDSKLNRLHVDIFRF